MNGGGIEPVASPASGAPAEVRATADAESGIGLARRAVIDAVVRWGCPNVDDVALVVSELVTDAVKHTTGGATAVVTHEPDGVVRVEVHDQSHAIVQLRPAAPMVAGGYGLRIVAELSVRWGSEHTDTGKVVWSVVACGH